MNFNSELTAALIKIAEGQFSAEEWVEWWRENGDRTASALKRTQSSQAADAGILGAALPVSACQSHAVYYYSYSLRNIRKIADSFIEWAEAFPGREK